MLKSARMILPIEQIRAYCDRHPIQRLAVFGSALRDDFGSKSDVDLLVEYVPGVPVSLMDMAEQEIELAGIVQRRVDLRTPNELSRHFRQQVIEGAMVIYERTG